MRSPQRVPSAKRQKSLKPSVSSPWRGRRWQMRGRSTSGGFDAAGGATRVAPLEHVVELEELLGELVGRSEVDERHRLAVALAHLDGGAQIGRQDGQALGEERVHQLTRQLRLRLEGVDDDALDAEARVVVLAQLGDGLDDLVDRLLREAVAVEGHETPLRRDERRAGVEADRRG